MGIYKSRRGRIYLLVKEIGYTLRPLTGFFILKKIMPITLDKKKKLVASLEKSFEKANSIVFVKFDKLGVMDANILRRKLQSQNINYSVTKKTLLKRALESKKVEGERPEIEGQIAVAFSEDLMAPSREIFNFSKSHKENIKIVGGIFEGRYLNENEMLSIATIPSLQTLRGMFVNLINSPIQRFAVVLDQIAQTKV